MRAELLAARLTPKQRDPREAGRSTKRAESLAAYTAGIGDKAWVYFRIVYLRDAEERLMYRLYLNVLLQVSDGWEPIGTKPQDPARLEEWQRKNGGLIKRLTEMAVAEALRPNLFGDQRTKRIAEYLGISERQWFREYKDRYARIWAILDAWDHEIRRNISRNQEHG